MIVTITLFTLFLDVGQAMSQQSERTPVLAGRLIEAARADAFIDQYVESARDMLDEMVKELAADFEKETTPEQIAELQAILNEELDLMKQDIAEPAKTMVMQFYTENFSDDELAELIGIYSSPVFQKMHETMPLLTRQTIEFGLELRERSGKRLMPRFEAWKEKYGMD